MESVDCDERDSLPLWRFAAGGDSGISIPVIVNPWNRNLPGSFP